MVTVIYDKDGIYKGKKDVKISDFSQYASAYISVKHALENPKDVFVVCTNRQIYKQFEDLSSFYPTKFMFKVFSIRTDFEEKYGVEIPDYITDKDLTVDESYKDANFIPGESFENAVLRKYTGPYFLDANFPFASLAEVYRELSNNALNDEKKIILRKIFQKRVAKFQEAAAGEYEQFILDQFLHDFDGLKADVALYLTICNYPESFRNELLGVDINRCMEQISVNGEPLKLRADLESEYRERATQYLHNDNIKFEEALKMVSGYYVFELNIILEKKSEFTDTDIIKLQNKFERLFAENPGEKQRIMELKAPLTLQKPEEWETIGEWLDWAINNYLPYKFWLELTDKHSDAADEFSSKYADWIYENYDSLVNSFPDMIYKILPSLINEFKSNTHSIVIMLDNFNYKFKEDLEKCLVEHKFNLQESKPVLAMMPTETAISKRAFFTGEPYNNNKSSYEKLISGWQEQTGLSMKYLPDIGALQEIETFEEKIIFLNFLKLDEMLHENQSGSALNIEIKIQNELKALVELIVSLLKKWGREKDTEIYFVADHGSTKISPNQPNEIDPKYYKEKAGDSNYRFIAVKDINYKEIKDATSGVCYPFDKDRYGTPDNYLIAKKYNRFIRKELKGYVHGGISPEENIVPFMHFTYDVVNCLVPSLTLENGKQLRFSVKTKLEICVKNLNSFSIKELQLLIINSNIKHETPQAIDLEGYEDKEIVIQNVRITKTLDSKYNEKLYIKLSYMVNGRKHTNTVILDMPVKSVQSSNADFSDLF